MTALVFVAQLAHDLLVDLGVPVSTELPADFETRPGQLPRIKIDTPAGSSETPELGWLNRNPVTVEAWATTRAASFALLALAVEALLDAGLAGVTVAGVGVVTGAALEGQPQWLPDPDLDLARYTATVALWAHPIPD